MNVNIKKRKCEISLTGVVKENGGILLLFLHMGAAPSSSHFLNHAKTINLMKLLLMEYHVLCIVNRVDHLKGGQHQKWVY